MIPLQLLSYHIAWSWAKPYYEFWINIDSKDVSKILIDPKNEMADIDMSPIIFVGFFTLIVPWSCLQNQHAILGSTIALLYHEYASRNENRLSDLKQRELILKDELSKMLLSAYKKKSNLNKLMFVFSSTSFQQAYKRIQYFKQYANFQSKTLSKIKINSNDIKNVIVVLDSQKTNKKLLIDENEEIKRDLSIEYTGLNNLIAEVNKNQKRYSAEIKQKQKLTREIDKKIQRLIEEALAKAKKKDGRFELTEEAKLISKNFNANKGKLPSPVIRGSVVLGFGKQPHPIVKTTTIQSNGVRIRTSSDVEARTIFNGVVYSIIKSKNNTHTILIQHGNFFTVYKNLSDIYVKKGDKLKTKDSIGKIATDPLNGQTILSFSIFNNGVPQNPRFWIYKM